MCPILIQTNNLSVYYININTISNFLLNFKQYFQIKCKFETFQIGALTEVSDLNVSDFYIVLFI